MINIKIIIALSAIALKTLAACSSSDVKKEPVADKPASHTQVNAIAVIPAFTMQDAMGKTIDLQSLKGKKVFVNLWAVWCPPCRREMPSIAALYAKADKQKTVFIMLSLDENFQSSLDFMKKNKLDLPVYFPSEKLPAMFDIDGIPATFIFNEAGELIKQNNGADDYDTDEYLRLLNS
jgi:thiol-disulfide isomerase/thioredoxin